MEENAATSSGSSNEDMKSTTKGESDQSKIEDSNIKKEPDDNAKSKTTDKTEPLQEIKKRVEGIYNQNIKILQMLEKLEKKSPEGKTTAAPDEETEKFQIFVREPMGDKAVTEVPGIGAPQKKKESAAKTGKPGLKFAELGFGKAIDLFAFYKNEAQLDKEKFEKKLNDKGMKDTSPYYKEIVRAFEAWRQVHLVQRDCNCTGRKCEEDVRKI